MTVFLRVLPWLFIRVLPWLLVHVPVLIRVRPWLVSNDGVVEVCEHPRVQLFNVGVERFRKIGERRCAGRGRCKRLKFVFLADGRPKLYPRAVEPAGHNQILERIGMERPHMCDVSNVAVEECWYSPELKIVILETDNVPCSRSFTNQVEKIIRGEPDVTKYQPPPDYARHNVEMQSTTQ